MVATGKRRAAAVGFFRQGRGKRKNLSHLKLKRRNGKQSGRRKKKNEGLTKAKLAAIAVVCGVETKGGWNREREARRLRCLSLPAATTTRASPPCCGWQVFRITSWVKGKRCAFSSPPAGLGMKFCAGLKVSRLFHAR